ncbi:hypothetical protein [Actinomadura chibensis]|uniref:Uncharacterized protein n=1 Tax=Actinomadura chibensis TaxID=392828 RepID=A0A5D0NW79_9ACTN|nr:hypothetical protein [Actinomadura chibensis]TYB48424.1 hypothetical protein FXF69_04280 [Actinomadura chibensis]
MPVEYEYVGPPEILAAVRPGSGGTRVDSGGDFTAWWATLAEDESAEPFTFVVGLDGVLRLAPRRSEHVACADGRAVLSAGEIAFVLEDGRHRVDGISNQSTGYCPDPASWPAVAAALDRVGLPHPGHFTDPIIFRRCAECGERNLVKDGHFFCAVCAAELPSTWNLSAEK